MKTTVFALLTLICLLSVGQKNGVIVNTDKNDGSYWKKIAIEKSLSPEETQEFVTAHLNNVSSTSQNAKVSIPPTQTNQYCTNLDFETGNLTGWTASTGYNPLYNAIGCCPNSGGAQLITTGAATDPCGGFPIVCPGGNFSLKLGDNNTGGIADRIEQTFLVTSNNAFFTYKYAVVLQDPGHAVANQPKFEIQLIDQNGNNIPCSYYSVTAGQNIPGFMSSPTCSGVIYKPWSSVSTDLTSYIGQNITIRFTTYDCALGGHYGYAYIDGSCLSFPQIQPDTICVGQNKTLCAPGGFASYLWSGTSVSGNTNQCVTVSASGTYSVQTTLFTGCQGPTFIFPIFSYPTPIPSFNAQNVCFGNTVNFTNNSTISSGNIISYQWDFGNGQTSNQLQPSYNYSNIGTYNVSLTATGNYGCSSTITNTVEVYPLPSTGFTANNVCFGTAVYFNNTSTVSSGSITSYQWNFGNGQTSNTINPQNGYTSVGIYTVSLTATTNNNCSSVYSNTIEVYPLPNIQFSTANVCANTSITFTNQSSIQVGQIVNYQWSFSNNTTSQNINPQLNISIPGVYSATLTTISNNNCIATDTQTFEIYALPQASFIINNSCAGTVLTPTNLTSISSGNIAAYQWLFGNNQYANQANPTIVYGNAGNYTISLTATSNHNCTNTATNIITIYPQPNAQYSVTTACFNQPNGFQNQSSVSSGFIAKYKWDFENDGIWDDSTNTNPSHIYPNFGLYHAKLATISNSGCTSQTINNVLVHANPIAGFATSKTCLGDITQFTNTSSSTDGNIVAYYWDLNADGFFDNVSANASFQYPAHGSYLITLEIQTEYGCTNVIKKQVYVNPNPNPMFDVISPKGCPTHCSQFQNNSSIVSGNIQTFQWLFGDGSASYQNNPNHCYESGLYSVTLKAISDSGCVGVYIANNIVEVYPNPIAGFSTNPDRALEDMSPIEVTNTAQNTIQTHYQLSDGSVFNTPNFTYNLVNEDIPQLIIYQQVSSSHGCRDSIAKIIDIVPTFAIYFPNAFTPNSDNLNDGFTAKGHGIKDFKMWVYDRWGHLIYETDDITKPWDGKDKNSAEAVPNDTYVWKAIVTDLKSKKHDFIGHVIVVK